MTWCGERRAGYPLAAGLAGTGGGPQPVIATSRSVVAQAPMPYETVATSTAETAAAVFGGVIALSGIAASLFFKAPEPSAPSNPATSLAERRREAGTAQVTGPDRSCGNAASDGELRAAVEARALVLDAARAELRERASRGEIR